MGSAAVGSMVDNKKGKKRNKPRLPPIIMPPVIMDEDTLMSPPFVSIQKVVQQTKKVEGTENVVKTEEKAKNENRKAKSV